MNKATFLALTLAGAVLVPLAQSAAAKRPPRAIEPSVWETRTFQRAHPDLTFRVSGQAHLEDRNYSRARSDFTEAARWGDKLSQAMLAEMLWDGIGVDTDRARAYAWMDLAAERGFVPFVAKRERYWAALDAQQRERALEVGRKLYAQYGDEIAQPRLRARLHKEARAMTGTRTGLPGQGTVILPTRGGARVTIFTVQGRSAPVSEGQPPPSAGNGGIANGHGGNQMSFDTFYAAEMWRPEPYARWQQEQLEFAQRGMVTVGELGDENGKQPGQL